MLGIEDRVRRGYAGSRAFFGWRDPDPESLRKGVHNACHQGTGIKKAIVEHANKKHLVVSEYVMTSREGHTATFMPVMPKKTSEPDEVKETDRYIVFAASARARSKQDLIYKIPDECKKRWEIETEYACMERAGTRAFSGNDSNRMLLLYLPPVVYNARIMGNGAAGACADGARPSSHPGALCLAYPDHGGAGTFLAVFSLSGICRVVRFQLLCTGSASLAPQ